MLFSTANTNEAADSLLQSFIKTIYWTVLSGQLYIAVTHGAPRPDAHGTKKGVFKKSQLLLKRVQIIYRIIL